MITKGVIVCDEQVPHHINLKSLNRFLKDFQPDAIVREGDMLDLTPLTGWTSLSPSAVDWDSIKDEIRIGNEILDEQDSLIKPTKKLFWLGNHELRLKYFLQKHPEWARKNRSWLPNIARDLKLRERGYRVFEQNHLESIGKLYFFHGDNYSTFHTKKNVEDLNINVVYGHTHSPQNFTKVSRINSMPKSAWSLGCLCNLNPEWKRGGPNAWVNGFAVFYVLPNGNFNLYPITMINGQFVAPNGKLYSCD